MEFSKKLLRWQKKHGRHSLPWQKKTSAYRVWVSEIMLQQTQVATVIPYYERFMKSFPTIKALAQADINDVLNHWSGLGYYARARNLHRTAQEITFNHKGQFPKKIEELEKLPGIGRSTAGAICSLAMGQSTSILDGNVKRILTRYFGIEGWTGESQINKQLWALSDKLTPKKEAGPYNQAMMDLGATVCTRTKPRCKLCPVSSDCKAYLENRQHELPTPKKKRIKPEKHTCLLILKDSMGKIFLEKRAPTGIWGGLWSFPECETIEEIETYCEKYFGAIIDKTKTWPSLKHQFSHFTLHITPVVIEITKMNHQVMDRPDRVWYKLSTILPGGIAAPVQKILNQFEEAYEPHDFL